MSDIYTVTFNQQLFTCKDPRAAAHDELDEAAYEAHANNFQSHWGPLNIHAGCCRRYGTSVAVSGLSTTPTSRTMMYEGTVGTCSGPVAAGTKNFSGDTFTYRCRHPSGAFAIVFLPGDTSGTLTGANFELDGHGHFEMNAQILGYVALHITGTATSPTTGTFTGTMTGAVTGTCVGSFNGSTSTATYTFTSPVGMSTGVGTGTYTIVGTDITFSGIIRGTRSLVFTDIPVYLRCTFSTCEREGVLVEMKKDADDSLLAAWCNMHHSLRNGYRTVLTLIEETCDADCAGLFPNVLCFLANVYTPACGDDYLPNGWTFTVGANGLGGGGSTSSMLGGSLRPYSQGAGGSTLTTGSTFNADSGTGNNTFVTTGAPALLEWAAFITAPCPTLISPGPSLACTGRATYTLQSANFGVNDHIFTVGAVKVYGVVFSYDYGPTSVTLPCSTLSPVIGEKRFGASATYTGGYQVLGGGTPYVSTDITEPSSFSATPSSQHYPAV